MSRPRRICHHSQSILLRLGSFLTGVLCFSSRLFAEFPPKPRTKCGRSYKLSTSEYHVSWGCNARPFGRIVETSGAREGCLLDRGAEDALTPRGATEPRELTSYKQLVARQSPPRQENSWRFRVDIAYVGESALSTDRESSRDAWRFLRPAMAWEWFWEWPWSIPIPHSAEWRRAAHTAHTVRLPDVLFCRSFVCNSWTFFRYFAQRKKSAKREIKMLQFVNFTIKTRRKENSY